MTSGVYRSWLSNPVTLFGWKWGYTHGLRLHRSMRYWRHSFDASVAPTDVARHQQVGYFGVYNRGRLDMFPRYDFQSLHEINFRRHPRKKIPRWLAGAWVLTSMELSVYVAWR
jgi:hypothetical protein